MSVQINIKCQSNTYMNTLHEITIYDSHWNVVTTTLTDKRGYAKIYLTKNERYIISAKALCHLFTTKQYRWINTYSCKKKGYTFIFDKKYEELCRSFNVRVNDCNCSNMIFEGVEIQLWQ